MAIFISFFFYLFCTIIKIFLKIFCGAFLAGPGVGTPGPHVRCGQAGLRNGPQAGGPKLCLGSVAAPSAYRFAIVTSSKLRSVRSSRFRAVDDPQPEILESFVRVQPLLAADDLIGGPQLHLRAPFVRHDPQKSLEPEVGP